jgi:hypothetical protein
LSNQNEFSFKDKVLGIKDVIYEYDKKLGNDTTDYEITFLK